MRAAGTIAFCAAFGVAGCSLFVSLDGLSDDAEPSAGDASPEADMNADALPASDGGNANADAADGNAIFLDDFNRPDAALIGNAWIEKHSTEFSLGDDQVVRGMIDNIDYPDNMVYRPASEDIGDSEISIELTFQANVAGYPQIHSRIQENTVTQAGTVDSYLLYVPNSGTQATLSRTRGQENLSDFTTANLSETMTPGERYRLRLRVIGANPVSLFGIVEHFESGAWKMIGEATALDSDPTQQLDDAGSVGFSCSSEDTDPYHYDNFMRTPL